MAFNVPGMLINVLIAWIYLTLVFFGVPSWARFGKKSSSTSIIKDDPKTRANVTKMLKQKYEDLGPMSFHEIGVGILFFIVVMLWFFRDPRFIKGWSEFIPHVDVGDSTAAMLVVVLLFIVPRSLSFFTGGNSVVPRSSVTFVTKDISIQHGEKSPCSI
jgi:sodium-dependent dicarboxylate transporter 2/3/5